jgi:hypothetical protein
MLVDPATKAPLHHVCTYRERCKLFRQEPCRRDQICLLDESGGTASCLHSAGKRLNEPCTFSNDCADGFVCSNGPDGGICRTSCLRADAGVPSPFDASVANAKPGYGGCPPKETCRVTFTNAPAWFGACAEGN